MPKEGDERYCGSKSFSQEPDLGICLKGPLKCNRCGATSFGEVPANGCTNVLEYRYPPRPIWSNEYGNLGWYWYTGRMCGWVRVD